MSALTVIKPGMLTTIQDLGRRGFQGLGVSVAGPMDWSSHRRANQILGNDPKAAALEITLIGPDLQADGDIRAAVAGAAFQLTLDDVAVPTDEAFIMRAGARLRFGMRTRGARATLAVDSGVDVPVVLGSRATHLVSGMGGIDGRALRSGDRLPVASCVDRRIGGRGRPLALPDGGAKVRVVESVHRDRFTDRAWRTLTSERFVVTPQSNRMGYRLAGSPLEHSHGADLLSEAMPIGALQVPASGLPILLMADRQTTGGYPTIANVITADLPLAGQLAPGDWIEFAACSLDDALEALRRLELELAGAITQ